MAPGVRSGSRFIEDSFPRVLLTPSLAETVGGRVQLGKEKRRVAIACQGGGSHTAFTAGVLKDLLTGETLDEQGYEIVALSGTSGGAICAFLTWYALLDGGKEEAAELLETFWIRDNSAYLKVGDLVSIGDVLVNDLVVGANRLAEAGLGMPGFSPYDFPVQSLYWRDRFKETIEKRVDFDLKGRVERSETAPMLFLGAANVLTGEFKVFGSHKKGEDGKIRYNDSHSDGISAEAILASAAVPTIFEAERFGEAAYWDGSRGESRVEEGVYWDGLYSQNPPLRDLAGAEPDEIWVIQINPEEIDVEPTATAKIADRQNELGGNLSLNQEIYFVRKINEIVRNLRERLGGETLSVSDGKEYRVIKVRRIELSIPLYTSSKLDRDPSHIRKLMEHGGERAGHFLATLPFQNAFEAAWGRARRDDVHLDGVMDLFAEDAVVRLVPPSTRPESGMTLSGDEIREALRWCLDGKANIEQSRDYGVSGETKSLWMLVTADHFEGIVKGRAELALREEGGREKISSFTFYPLTLETIEALRDAMAGRSA